MIDLHPAADRVATLVGGPPAAFDARNLEPGWRGRLIAEQTRSAAI